MILCYSSVPDSANMEDMSPLLFAFPFVVSDSFKGADIDPAPSCMVNEQRGQDLICAFDP